LTARNITPEHRASISIRLVDENHRTVTYQDIKIARTIDGEAVSTGFRRNDARVAYMQYCIRAVNLPNDAVIEVSDMYIEAVE
jgi:hypothetical protein